MDYVIATFFSKGVEECINNECKMHSPKYKYVFDIVDITLGLITLTHKISPAKEKLTLKSLLICEAIFIIVKTNFFVLVKTFYCILLNTFF